MGDVFYILSLDHTSGGVVTWWRPDNQGYTTDLNQAGRYTRRQVEAARSYYDNGDQTMAVPCEAATAMAEEIRLVDNGHSTRSFLQSAHDTVFAPEKVA